MKWTKVKFVYMLVIIVSMLCAFIPSDDTPPTQLVNSKWQMIYLSKDLEYSTNINPMSDSICFTFKTDTMKLTSRSISFSFLWRYEISQNAIRTRIPAGAAKDTMSYFIQSLTSDTMKLYYFQHNKEQLTHAKIYCRFKKLI